MTELAKTFSVLKTAAALFAASALVVLLGTVAPARAVSPSDGRFITTELPGSPAGIQMQWFVDASTRLPLGAKELGAHFDKAFLAQPSATPAKINLFLQKLFGASGAHLLGLVAAEPRALVAVVTGRNGQELVVTLVVDRTGLIGFPTAIRSTPVGPKIVLPPPSGTMAVGTDTLQLVDHARGGRRLMLTRWYPAPTEARSRPLVSYASPRLSTVIGLPQVRVHAHSGAHAIAGRLPVVLFSPGGNTPRVIYQALAEDLASHGYLVIAVDHSGEAPVELPDGRIELPTWWANPPKPTTTFDAGVQSAQQTRLLDLQLILRQLPSMPTGPVPDLTRIASIGHSLGGSTSAALMRVDRRIRAGIDLDGSIFGTAAKRGVPRAFLILGEGGLDPSTRGLLEHSSGPRLGLNIAGLQHMSFSDLPVLAPSSLSVGKWRASAQDVVLQRIYVRGFLDRFLLGRRSPLLDAPSGRYPRVTFIYRRL